MTIPLILRLKKTAHREVAKAQDLVVETLYEVIDDAVIHGGTAIWRCYKGNRFSEDIDVYIRKDKEKINEFFASLEKKGFSIEKRKIGDNSIYSTLKLGQTEVRFEALFKKATGSLQEYEKAEGNFISVYTLTPEELIKEKVDTYLKRMKIRDLYDIFFLLRYADYSSVEKEIKKLLSNFKEPVDESNLKVIILEGLVPTAEEMLNYIRRK